MKLVSPKKELIRLVGSCVGVVQSKGTMPVLANVYINATGDSLTCMATDLYMSVVATGACETKRDGSVCIPARDLFERIKAMPDGGIEITAHDNGLVELKSTTSPRKFKLHGLSGDAFPQVPRPHPDDKRLTIGAQALLALITSTQFSIASDETRPHLNSALVEWGGGKVRMVTTDGHRLTKSDVAVEGPDKAEMLIPLKGICELRKLCEEAISSAGKSKDPTIPDITIALQGPNAIFTVPWMELSVKLVDAQFPAYQQVIPKSLDKRTVAPRDALIEAVRAVSLAASDRTNGIKLSIENGTMRITTESPDSGDGSDEIPVEHTGAPITIGLCARYLLDTLGAVGSDVVIETSGELDPMLISPAQEGPGRSFQGVVMPMRI